MRINCILNFFKIFIRTKVSLFEHICLFVCNTRLGEFLSLPIAVDLSGSFFVCNKQRNFWSDWYFAGIQNAVYPHFELMNILKKMITKEALFNDKSWKNLMTCTFVPNIRVFLKNLTTDYSFFLKERPQARANFHKNMTTS